MEHGFKSPGTQEACSHCKSVITVKLHLCVESHRSQSRSLGPLTEGPLTSKASSGGQEHGSSGARFLCNVWVSALCPLNVPQKQQQQQKRDQSVTQPLHERVPDKTNKSHPLNSQQLFTACLPRLGTVLGSENTMVTKARKGPSLMELGFK